MKKIIAFILLMCLLLTLVACADNGNNPPEDNTTEDNLPEDNTTEDNPPKDNTTEDTTPEGANPEDTTPEDTKPAITLQEVYDAGKNLTALLGDHENVYVQVISNGKLIREEYLSKQYCYSFYDSEFMDIGFDYASFATDNSEYYYFENVYALNVTLTPSGMVEMTDILALLGENAFISSEVMNDDSSIIEKDGFITVTCNADLDEITVMGDDVVSCVETYTLDAKTREMTAIKTVYTYEDGTVDEGIVTITRDVEAPEGMTPFLTYVQETENMRTVTIVSNPGTENEKTESIQVAKGLQVALSTDFAVEETFTMYADAACTQTFEEEWDVNTDLTIYVKWDE